MIEDDISLITKGYLVDTCRHNEMFDTKSPFEIKSNFSVLVEDIKIWVGIHKTRSKFLGRSVLS